VEPHFRAEVGAGIPLLINMEKSHFFDPASTRRIV
jgi:hypothetical protein